MLVCYCYLPHMAKPFVLLMLSDPVNKKIADSIEKMGAGGLVGSRIAQKMGIKKNWAAIRAHCNTLHQAQHEN